MDRNSDVVKFISKYFYFKKARVANFVDIIKITTMFIKTTFTKTEKVKRIRNYVLKWSL